MNEMNNKDLLDALKHLYTTVIDANGTQYWYKDGKQHRDGDLPALIYANGTQGWYKDGKKYTPGEQQ